MSGRQLATALDVSQTWTPAPGTLGHGRVSVPGRRTRTVGGIPCTSLGAAQKLGLELPSGLDRAINGGERQRLSHRSTSMSRSRTVTGPGGRRAREIRGSADVRTEPYAATRGHATGTRIARQMYPTGRTAVPRPGEPVTPSTRSAMSPGCGVVSRVDGALRRSRAWHLLPDDRFLDSDVRGQPQIALCVAVGEDLTGACEVHGYAPSGENARRCAMNSAANASRSSPSASGMPSFVRRSPAEPLSDQLLDGAATGKLSPQRVGQPLALVVVGHGPPPGLEGPGGLVVRDHQSGRPVVGLRHSANRGLPFCYRSDRRYRRQPSKGCWQ
jgi:hypothetical protein